MDKIKEMQIQQVYEDIRELAESVDDCCILLIPDTFRIWVESFELYAAISPFVTIDVDGFIFGHFVKFEDRYSIDITPR